MGDLGPIDEDVRFDHGAAERLISLCNAAAGVIDGQTGSRASWVATAQRDFEGHFSRLFTSNARIAAADAHEVAAKLRDVARFTSTLAEEARSEQARRDKAREWQRERDERNLAEKGWDWLTNDNDAPVPDMPQPSSFEATPIPAPPRQTPAPGSGGGRSGGTSSARPSNLRAFASGSRGANASLEGKPTSCRSAYAAFEAGCGWGRLTADSVFAGFVQYLEANEEDIRWAATVASAFEAAGGEGAVSTLSNSALMAALRAKGIDASRQDIVIDPPTAYGNPPTSGYADDPVNAATGNFIENETDLTFAGGAATLVLTRTYNSFDTGSGAFGPGWSSWTEAGLTLDDEAARMRLPDGRVVVFPRLGEGWDRATGESMWLTRDGDRLVATTNDGERWTYAAGGRLVEHSRGAGTTVRLTHDPASRVVRLEHERGRAVDLAWDGERDRVVEATASDGRRVAYDYDDGGRLLAVATALGTRSYRWDEQGLVAAVVDADGVVEAENAYDDLRRVTSQRSRHGRVSRFVYLPGNVTVVSDTDGSRSNTWLSDHRGRLVGVVDSHEQRQSFAYDTHGNRVMVTERDGSTTIREYDDRGRMTREVIPSGADLTYGYDDADRVTTVVHESGGVVEYSYDGDDRNPSVLVDPEGGRTEMTWTEGLLTRVVDPVGVVVTFDHDAHGDLVATTDALGNSARLERDPHGRVVAAVSPMGHRTTYTYAPSGVLASRRDPDGAVWRFEHTAAGRLSAVVDPTGSRTEIEHDAAGDEVRTIDPLGRATGRRFDDFGNLAVVELPEGSTWRFGHDSLSRLVSATAPDGATWTREHDVNGGLVATVDPTGVRQGITTDARANTVTVDDGAGSVSTRFDALGRPVAAEAADGSAVMATYDRCGRVVEQLDAEGGLTRIARDAAGRPVSITSPEGRTTSYEYDERGRLSAVADPVGARTTRHYDGDSRLVAVTLPTGDVARTDYDACGRVVATRRPGHGVARYRYDAAGRVVEASDTWYGRRKFRYDAAGQLVEAVNGNGGVTRFEHDANGRTVSVTDPLGHTTHREFDDQDRCVAETDPLGRVTRAGYDGAGRQVWQEDPDGRRFTLSYDGTGRLSGLSADGRVVSSITRDVLGRRCVVTDHTRDDHTTTIEVEWNRRGQLVRRARDGHAVTWSYDGDGRRTALTTPGGATTTYAYDSAGRLASVDHPLLGRAHLVHDAAGRVVEATAGGTVQTWEHDDGHVTAHTIGDDRGFTRTEVHRDDDGRIVGLARGEDHTAFGYDEACQLIESRTGGSVNTWRYDAAGRLVAETVDGATVEHTYDAAGQLLTSHDGRGTTEYAYDGAGRRTRRRNADGTVRELAWTATGWLVSVTDRRPGGQETRTRVHVDATGELAEVDGVAVHWDSAAYAPSLLEVGGAPVLSAGPVTAVGGAWAAAGWRTARATGSDPWAAAGGTGPVPLPGGVTVGPDGGLEVAGMEWLGARVYDPASRGFLSVDPLDAHLGAGWAGNPYSYAGNDPLHALDPLGLEALTDEDLRAYNAANNTGLGAVKRWATDHAYIVGGVMVVAGVLMVATGVGGPAGMMLISAGADTIIQKATTGTVNWGQVAVSGAMGFAGGAAGSYAVKAGMTGARALAFNMGSNAAIGGVGESVRYVLADGPATLRGAGGAAFSGVVSGGAMGGSNQLGDLATRNLGGVTQRVGTHVVSGLIDGAGGAAGNAGSQYMATGRVDGREVALAGGAGTVTGAGADAFSHGVDRLTGGRQLPYNPQHSAEGGRHRAHDFWDIMPGGAGADVPSGTLANAVFDPDR